jgi:hypothetical protein
MAGTRGRRKFHKITLAEVGEIVRTVHIQQASPSPVILGSPVKIEDTQKIHYVNSQIY